MLYQPTYFPTIETFGYLKSDKDILFEVFDNYQKQTYRTRCSIYAANGQLDLIIPIKHNKGKRQLTKEVRVENHFNWQKQHFKSLQNAYRSSPFFEFYEHEIEQFYNQKFDYLSQVIWQSIALSFKLLDLKISHQTTTIFKENIDVNIDKRHLADFKNYKTVKSLKPYIQVFKDKYGFIPNLSILDLIFNEGPNVISYLD